eukprot:2147616-Rhodomonas_salina.1
MHPSQIKQPDPVLGQIDIFAGAGGATRMQSEAFRVTRQSVVARTVTCRHTHTHIVLRLWPWIRRAASSPAVVYRELSVDVRGPQYRERQSPQSVAAPGEFRQLRCAFPVLLPCQHRPCQNQMQDSNCPHITLYEKASEIMRSGSIPATKQTAARISSETRNFTVREQW